MIRKVIYITTIALLLQFSSAHASSEGNENLSSKSPDTANECFEGFSRAMFKFNNGLDAIIFWI